MSSVKTFIWVAGVRRELSQKVKDLYFHGKRLAYKVGRDDDDDDDEEEEEDVIHSDKKQCKMTVNRRTKNNTQENRLKYAEVI